VYAIEECSSVEICHTPLRVASLIARGDSICVVSGTRHPLCSLRILMKCHTVLMQVKLHLPPANFCVKIPDSYESFSL